MPVKYEFKKIYAMIPEDLYRQIAERGLFKDFDRLITELLVEYLNENKNKNRNRKQHEEDEEEE